MPSEKCNNCIYGIPCCGGFCAPTENPDESCFRHVSNEFTVPLGPNFFKVLACIETPRPIRMLGRIGLPCADRFRKQIMLVGLFLNVLGLFFALYAALGVTTDISLLSSTYFVRGEAKIASLPDLAPRIIYVGAFAKVDEMDCAASSDDALREACVSDYSNRTVFEKFGDKFRRVSIWTDSETCSSSDEHDLSQEAIREWDETCSACQGAQFMPLTLIVAVASQLPVLQQNCQRMTRFGDINFMSTMGTVMNFVGAFPNVINIFGFHQACNQNLPTKLVSVSGQDIDIEWTYGFGFWCMVCGIIVKVLDGIGHLVLRTPAARWEPPTGKPSTTVDYLRLKPDPAPEKVIP